MEAIWTSETGWSQKPLPYILYSGSFGAVMAIGGLFPSPDGPIGYTWISAIAVTVAMCGLGVVFWLVARAARYCGFGTGNGSALNKMPEQ